MQIAHQRRIREQESRRQPDDLFGAYWTNINHDIGKSIVRPVSLNTARSIVERYEWLGTMPAVSLYAFGIFFDGHCGGVVVYSSEYTENLGVWDRYGYSGKIILLARGACVHWAHPHAGSRLIRRSMDLLPPRYRVVTATVDTEAGEIGTIYQACGFDYVGQMSIGGQRASLRTVDGTRISGRQLGRLYGTRGVHRLRAAGVQANAVDRKRRYFGFRGNPKEVAALRAAILDRIQPYPKRANTPCAPS